MQKRVKANHDHQVYACVRAIYIYIYGGLSYWRVQDIYRIWIGGKHIYIHIVIYSIGPARGYHDYMRVMASPGVCVRACDIYIYIWRPELLACTGYIPYMDRRYIRIYIHIVIYSIGPARGYHDHTGVCVRACDIYIYIWRPELLACTGYIPLWKAVNTFNHTVKYSYGQCAWLTIYFESDGVTRCMRACVRILNIGGLSVLACTGMYRSGRRVLRN